MKLILLDRDGVINQDSLRYIKSVEEFIIIPSSLEAIARLTKAGYTIGVATNQSGISRGHYSEETLTDIHKELYKKVRAAGGDIHSITFCKHMPDEGCVCRKPQPGMLLKLAENFKSDLKNVPFIGDRISDIQAAYAAGAKPMIVLSQMTDKQRLKDYPEVPFFRSLADCVEQILNHDDL